MNVTPLFHEKKQSGCLEDEQLYLLLDEPETSEKKRAFLNHCSICESCLHRWRAVSQIEQLGTHFQQQEPDPAIRSRVLEAAYQEIHKSRASVSLAEKGRRERLFSPQNNAESQNRKKQDSFSLWNLPGWRIAWAALILVMSWGAYLQFQHTETVTQSPNIEYVDEELLTLEYELEALQQELDHFFKTSIDENA